jgi:hypothetical protein
MVERHQHLVVHFGKNERRPHDGDGDPRPDALSRGEPGKPHLDPIETVRVIVNCDHRRNRTLETRNRGNGLGLKRDVRRESGELVAVREAAVRGMNDVTGPITVAAVESPARDRDSLPARMAGALSFRAQRGARRSFERRGAVVA